MRTIYGEEIGTTIDFRTVGPYTMHHDWPASTAVSAGNGVVFGSRAGGSYTTLFMECYPPEGGFLRGEGETPEDCEDAVWAKYQLMLHCAPDTDGSPRQHQFDPAGYKNGSGICTHCGTWRQNVFTAEQLGQVCHVCQEPTIHSWRQLPDGTLQFACEKHTVRLARCRNLHEHPDLTATACDGALRFGPDDLDAACDSCGARCGRDVADYLSAAFDTVWLDAHSAG